MRRIETCPPPAPAMVPGTPGSSTTSARVRQTRTGLDRKLLVVGAVLLLSSSAQHCPSGATPIPRVSAVPGRLARSPVVLPRPLAAGIFPAIEADWDLPAVLDLLAERRSVTVESSAFGRFFKYFGKNSPISERFPVALRTVQNASLRWVSEDRPSESQKIGVRELLQLGGERCGCGPTNCSKCYYIQQSLGELRWDGELAVKLEHESVGMRELVGRLVGSAWGALSNASEFELTPVVWANPEPLEVITPMHYDLGSNLHCVMAGRKQFWMMPPRSEGVRAYPLLHPMARQAVSFSLERGWPDLHPDQAHRVHYADVLPGECILLPGSWWHEVAAAPGSVSLSGLWPVQSPEERLAGALGKQQPAALSFMEWKLEELVSFGFLDALEDPLVGMQRALEFFAAAETGRPVSEWVPPNGRRMLEYVQRRMRAEFGIEIGLRRLVALMRGLSQERYAYFLDAMPPPT